MEIEDHRRYEIELARVMEVVERQKNNKKMPLLVYQLLDEMAWRRSEDQSKRHFYELSGNLSNLYTSGSIDKAIIWKELEEDINDKI